MKVIYAYKEGMKPYYVSNTNGTHRVLLVIDNDRDYIIYYCNDFHRKSHIGKIINKYAADMYNLSNFVTIQSDEEFNFYDKYITENYNYNAIHVNEKIDGADQGGPVLWLPEAQRKK